MNVPWLSILVPVYNVKPYLDECFQSILSQVDFGVEIIALDDQSTDGSLEHLRLLASMSRHPITILQHDQNHGVSVARNTLVKHARGEYLWFLDSDDVMNEGAISALHQIVNQYGPDLVMCDYERWYAEARPDGDRSKYVRSFGGPANKLSSDLELLFGGLYEFGKLHVWSKISRRYLWESGLQFPEGKYFEDMVITPRLALNARNFYYCASAWVRYRQRESSILATFTLKKIDDMLSGVDGVWSLWQQRIPSMGARSRYFFIRYCVKVYMYAAKEGQRINSGFRINSPEIRCRLLHSIGMGRKEMIKFYLLNGDFLRLIKTLKALA